MPEILINGEKKKVACGPCIRGHRSSKCQHRDRVLIEVRKPGRPLSACPHPSGSCSCERAVVYTVPKSSECPCPATSVAITSPAVVTAARISKPKVRKSVSNVTPSTVQRAIDGDPSVLAQHVNQRNDSLSLASPDSSGTPSLVSSSSSTPQIAAIDRNMQRSDSLQQAPQPEIKDENRGPRLQLGMMGVGGYRASADNIGWGGEWPDVNSRPPPTPGDDEDEDIPSCCKPQAITEEPVNAPEALSCCSSKPPNQFAIPGPVHQQPSQQLRSQMSLGLPNGLQNGRSTFQNGDLGLNFTDQFALPDNGFNAFPHGQGPDFFSNFEGRHGCGAHISLPGQLSGEDHNCHCGDSCACLGCAMHPANRTTTEYVRWHNELALRGDLNSAHIQIPFNTYQQPLPYSSHNVQNTFGQMNAGPMSQYQQNQFAPRFNPGYTSQQDFGMPWQAASPMSIHTPTTEMQQLQLHGPMTPSTPTGNANFPLQNDYQGFAGQVLQDRPGSQRPQPNPNISRPAEVTRPSRRDSEVSADHDSPSTEDDTTSTLSPSSFYVQQFNVPGCNDVTGTCHCGDGCQCPGCLTHSGHGNRADSESAVNQARRASQALEQSTSGPGQDLNGFNIEGFHGNMHDNMFPTSVPG